MHPEARMCLTCKGGRNLCGLGYCPLYEKMKIQAPISKSVGEEVFGPCPPNLFVGRHGYPRVSWGPMVDVSETATTSCSNDDPKTWKNLSYSELISIRSNVVRSESTLDVNSTSKLLCDAQEAVLSVKPVDVEVTFSRKPKMEVSFSPITQPMGPSGPLKSFRVCENPVIPKRVDEVVEERMLAVEAAGLLWNSGFDVYYLTKILSGGILGKEGQRKMVPTRWSITASDDIVAKQLMQEIREFEEVKEFMVFSNEYLHNRFEVLLMPGAWEYENFEAWAPKTLWTEGAKAFELVEEYEGFGGRTKYAEKEGGGYYAARIAACEALAKMKKQARVVVFREVYEGYVVPLGVWQVRENVRQAFEKPARKFATREEALKDIAGRLRLEMKEYAKQSVVLRQRKLSEF
ncbi:hypothetical protein HY992_01135 [Candidatus Micrarchaeota archaeon]|nr:hypothetical protein [Candidatus Micrarchaeota archaeon]